MLPRPFLLVLIPGHSSPPPATASPSTSHFTSSAKALNTVSFNTQLIFASWISLSSGHPWWFLLPRATHFLAPVWLTVERTMWLPGLDYNRFLSLLHELCWAIHNVRDLLQKDRLSENECEKWDVQLEASIYGSHLEIAPESLDFADLASSVSSSYETPQISTRQLHCSPIHDLYMQGYILITSWSTHDKRS